MSKAFLRSTVIRMTYFPRFSSFSIWSMVSISGWVVLEFFWKPNCLWFIISFFDRCGTTWDKAAFSRILDEVLSCEIGL